MPSVAAVRLTYNPKVLWFARNGVEFAAGDALIVRTERGLEYGVADEGPKEVDQKAVKALKCPLKPVVRKATAEDALTWKSMQAKAEEALPVFKRMVAERGLDMHPVTVEFLFDGDKAIFYFEAEERVDFRELVRALAAHFHVRIDMRQIGVRDEARIVGGLGHCGQELCCKRLGGEFNPVSIRMAKDQDLSLNPQKISGVCGRLMCCLRYEADTYKAFKACCPKMNSMVSTPEGDAKVVEINVPRETVTIATKDARVKVPVARMEKDKKTGKPGVVPADVYEECLDKRDAPASSSGMLVTPMFTGTDKLADAQARSGARRGADGEGKRPSRKRRRSGKARGADAQASSRDAGAKQQRAQGKRDGGRQQQVQGSKQRGPKQGRPQAAGAPSKTRRPGQRSSGLSEARPQDRTRRAGAASEKPRPQDRPARPAQGDHRRSRRRSHKAQGSDSRQD